MSSKSEKSKLLEQAAEKLASFNTLQLKDFLQKDSSEFPQSLFIKPTGLLHVEGNREFDPFDFYSERNRAVFVCVAESFSKKVLIHAKRKMIVPDADYQYGDLRKDGIDLKVFSQLQIKTKGVDHVLGHIANLLYSKTRQNTSDSLAISQKNKIATNIFYAHNQSKSAIAIGLRYIESKKMWRLFGWELGERDKQSDVCRIFFHK